MDAARFWLSQEHISSVLEAAEVPGSSSSLRCDAEEDDVDGIGSGCGRIAIGLSLLLLILLLLTTTTMLLLTSPLLGAVVTMLPFGSVLLVEQTLQKKVSGISSGVLNNNTK